MIDITPVNSVKFPTKVLILHPNDFHESSTMTVHSIDDLQRAFYRYDNGTVIDLNAGRVIMGVSVYDNVGIYATQPFNLDTVK